MCKAYSEHCPNCVTITLLLNSCGVGKFGQCCYNLCQGGYVLSAVCLSVCFFVLSVNKTWAKEEPIKFWSKTKSQGGSTNSFLLSPYHSSFISFYMFFSFSSMNCMIPLKSRPCQIKIVHDIRWTQLCSLHPVWFQTVEQTAWWRRDWHTSSPLSTLTGKGEQEAVTI